MANVQKYTLASVGHMFNHYGRQEGDGVIRANKEIKQDKTHENYNLAPTRTSNGKAQSQTEMLKKRLSEVKHLDLSKRKDINVMCDWVITLPQDVPIEKADAFFKHTYKFCAERYGEENVISAWVHKDENTPHMHFSFVPVVKDKDGTDRLCAKERVSKFELTKFHPDLQQYVEGKMNQPVAILNGATSGGNLTIIELKIKKATEELVKLQMTKEELKTAKPIVDKAIEFMNEVTELFRELDKDLKTKKFFGDDSKAQMKAVFKEIDNITEMSDKASKIVKYLLNELENLDENSKKSVENFTKNLQEAQKGVQRRIKRTERKLQRREERLKEKEKHMDLEIRKGVQKELDKLEKPISKKKAEIEALDEEIKRKKQQLVATDTDFWSRQEYLRTAKKQQQQFTETLQKWSEENESKNVKSNYPDR